MLQVVNTTPFPAQAMVMTDRYGADTLVVAIKATFSLLPKVVIAEEQVPLTLVDEYYDTPESSSVKYPADIYPPKPGYDVVFRGSVHAPDQKPVSALLASLTFQGRASTLLATGDRVWRGGKPSAPAPFTCLPVQFERCYGGVHHFRPDEPMGPKSCVYVPENPVGLGFAGKHKAKDVEGLALPNFEDPNKRLQIFGDNAPVVGWGAVAPSWQARSRYAGTYDEYWQANLAPALPKDFDERFFHVGAEGLCFPQGRVAGGESIKLSHLCAQSEIAFSVPHCPLDVSLVMLRQKQELLAEVETILLEPDENRFTMTWKSAFRCERRATMIDRINVNFARVKVQ